MATEQGDGGEVEHTGIGKHPNEQAIAFLIVDKRTNPSARNISRDLLTPTLYRISMSLFINYHARD